MVPAIVVLLHAQLPLAFAGAASEPQPHSARHPAYCSTKRSARDSTLGAHGPPLVMLGEHDVAVPEHHWAALLVGIHNVNTVYALLEDPHLTICLPDDYSAVPSTGHLHHPKVLQLFPRLPNDPGSSQRTRRARNGPQTRYCGDPTKQGFESIQNGYGNYFVNRNANEKGFLLDVDLNVLVLIGICRIVAPVRAAHNLPIGAQNLSVVIS